MDFKITILSVEDLQKPRKVEFLKEKIKSSVVK